MMFLIFVTLTSLIAAVVMSIVAWRAAAEERRHSEARLAALAADIRDDRGFDSRPDPVLSAPLREPTESTGAASYTDWLPSTADGRDIFGAVQQPAPTGSRLAIVAAIGVIVVGGIAMFGLLSSSGSHTPTRTETTANRVATASDSTPQAASTRSASVPLELVALGHDRDGDRLTVRGVVRNPSAGTRVERLTAVVFMFKRDGSFLGSGRATVESPALAPGGESTFVVTVPGAADVGRYRVSFRTDDRIVPHVDRREQSLARS